MKISFVIPCYRSQKTLAGVIHEVQETMATLNGYTYEIILVMMRHQMTHLVRLEDCARKMIILLALIWQRILVNILH